ncbi:MAG: hypothetical protein AAB776_04375 [Patescibacteria group bacterium]
MSFISKLDENETAEDGKVRLMLHGRRVTGQLIDLMLVGGKPLAIVSVIDPPENTPVVRTYVLNRWNRAVVAPVNDEVLEATALEVYRHKHPAAT